MIAPTPTTARLRRIDGAHRCRVPSVSDDGGARAGSASSSRYFATVRRASATPSSASASAISWSRQRVAGVLGLDHPPDLVLHPERGREEVAERHDLAGRDHDVLLGGRAADGRLVHPDQLADLGPRQRHEVLDAVDEVVALPIDEGLGDALDRGAAAVDVVDEELRAADVLANVLLLVLGRLVAAQLRAESASRSGPRGG